MPLYEYICQTCGERFEKLIRGDVRAQEIVCPSCASAAITRALDLRDQRQQRCACGSGLRPSWLRHLRARPCAALIQPVGHRERRVSGTDPDTRRSLFGETTS